MAVKRRVPLTRINGIAAGSTGTISLDVGPLQYHQITLGYKTATVGGATEATIGNEITEIRMILNGVVQRRFSPAQLFNLNRQKGKTPTVSASTAIPGYITMLLSEPQRRTTDDREATAWGMMGVGSFQIEVDIASTAASPVLTGFALIDDQPLTTGGIVKWKRETIPVTATGDVNYNLDTIKGDSYQGVTFIETTAGDVANIELTWDGLLLHKDDSNVFVENMNISDYTRVTKYRHVPLDFNDLRNIVRSIKQDPRTGAISKVGAFNAKLTMAGAANVTVMREAVGRPD